MTSNQGNTDRSADGTFSHGNAFWKLRDTHGRTSLFETDDELWRACVSYFDWATENPLKEDRVFSYQGEQTHESVSLLRAFTLSGLCLHLGITEETWRAWRRDRPDLKEVIAKAESVIRQQKFEGAAAGLLNANIISRDLGLTDKKDHQSSDGSMSATDPPKLSKLELARRIAFLFAQAEHEMNEQNEE